MMDRQVSRIGHGTLMLFVARAVNAVCLLAITVAISRLLGPVVFGGYSFLQTVVTTGIIIANLGLDTYLVREVSSQPNRANELLSTVIKYKFIAGMLTAVLIVVSARIWIDNDQLFRLLTIWSFAIPFVAAAYALWHYGDGHLRFAPHAFLWAGTNVVKLGAVWWGISLGAGLAGIVYIMAAIDVSILGLSWFVVRKRFRIVIGSSPNIRASEIIGSVWPLAVIFILSAVQFRFAMLALEFLLGESAVGMYAAGFRLIELVSIVPGTVALTLLPGLSARLKASEESFGYLFRRTLGGMVGVGAALAIALFAAARPVVSILYGPLFEDAADCLRVLAVTVVFIFINHHMAYSMIAARREREVMAAVAFAFIVSVSLTLNFAMRWHSVGAAYATLASEGALVGFYVWRVCAAGVPGVNRLASTRSVGQGTDR